MAVSRTIKATFSMLAVATLLVSSIASGQSLSGTSLVDAIAEGGYVFVIRNARSPQEAPAEGDRSPANMNGDREIDEYGQGQMSVIGFAFRELGIPVGRTYSSPAYRSQQSADYFGFGEHKAVEMLEESADSAWLAERIAQDPPGGENTVIVTHGRLITEALGRDARDFGEAETLIYDPGAGEPRLVARLSVEDWAKLAVN
jgi:phosphohistidine phosphatase SixA